jgi:hypothetical protein
MSNLYNLARMTSPTTGAGAPVVLDAAVNSFVTFSQAGAQDGDVISYAIDDGNNREVGRSIYVDGATPMLSTRDVFVSTNNNTPIALSGNAQVSITALAEDIAGGPLDGGTF